MLNATSRFLQGFNQSLQPQGKCFTFTKMKLTSDAGVYGFEQGGNGGLWEIS